MQYKHPENKGKPYVDWRDKALRKEVFFNWLNWRLSGKNIDHFTWNISYMNTTKSPTGLPMTEKQKLWYSFLFGMTYQSSLAWIFYWHFPDFEKIDLSELDRWNRETMPLQRFATDTRYNKGHIVSMVESLQGWANRNGQGCLKASFEKFLVEDEAESYHNINNEIQTLHKFGRMTGWLFAQCLYEGCKLPITPDTMFTDDPSNISVWNGMMYYIGEEHKTVGSPPKFAGYKPTPSDRMEARRFEVELMAEARDRVIDQEFLSYFTLETHLCQFKKLNVGHDYPGQNVGDAVLRCNEFKKKWPSVRFDAFDDAVNSTIFENIRWKEESKELMWLFNKTGQLINMDNMYPELPNMMLELGLEDKWFFDGVNETAIKSKIESYLEKEPTGLSSLFS